MLNYELDLAPESVWRTLTSSDTVHLPFTVTESGRFYAGPRFFTERDSKPQYYLIYTASGTGAIGCRGQERLLQPGDAALFYCDSYHHYQTEGSGPWEHLWVHFAGASAPAFDELVNNGGFSTVSIRDRLSFEQTFDELLAIHGVPDVVKSVTLSACVSQLLSAMVLDRRRQARSVRHGDDIARAIDYIRQHYDEPVTLDDLTGTAHLSKYYFVKLFREHTASSPYEYLLNYRINKAKQLLRKSDAPVTQVAEQVGFLNENNFIKQFKAATGYTPLGYRKNAW